MLRAVFEDLLRFGALSGGADVEDACLKATRAESAPMRLSEAQHERVFNGIAPLKESRNPLRTCAYSSSCSSGRTTTVEEQRPCR
jgi:hypothetical protein